MSLLTNLVSYWKLDESSGNAADAHGSNTLTNNNTTPFAAGMLNNGADFEAGSSQSFSLADASQSGLDLSTALSFSMWVKLESAPGTQYQLINKLSQPANESYFFAYRTAGGTAHLRLSVDETGLGILQDIYAVNQTLNNGQWYHLAVTWDGPTMTAKLYVDGAQIGSDQTNSQSDAIYNGAAAFGLGTPLVEGFDGMMDEVGVWSRVLTAAEVAALYNSGTPAAYADFGSLPVTGPAASRRTVNAA